MGFLSEEEKKELRKEHKVSSIKEYNKSPEGRKVKKKNRLDRYKRNRIFIENFKIGKKCKLCGYSEHPEILVFHHKKGVKKLFTLADSRTYPLETLKKEIKKCILICPNCHNWKHRASREALG